MNQNLTERKIIIGLVVVLILGGIGAIVWYLISQPALQEDSLPTETVSTFKPKDSTMSLVAITPTVGTTGADGPFSARFAVRQSGPLQDFILDYGDGYIGFVPCNKNMCPESVGNFYDEPGVYKVRIAPVPAQSECHQSTYGYNKTLPASCIKDAVDSVTVTVQSDGTSIQVLEPQGGETFKIGDTMHIRWKTAGVGLEEKLFVGLMDTRLHPDGADGSQVIAHVPNSGSYDWVIPNSITTPCEPEEPCLGSVKILGDANREPVYKIWVSKENDALFSKTSAERFSIGPASVGQ